MKISTKKFSLYLGDADSVFVWSSYGQKTFASMPQLRTTDIVVITNGSSPYISVYDASEVDASLIIDRHIAQMTSGCNYTYKVVNVLGNTYFLN